MNQTLASYNALRYGVIGINPLGEDLRNRYQALRKEYDELNASYAGAVLVGLFLRHPWLSGVTLTLLANAEWDDSGDYYRSISAKVSEINLVKGVDLPEVLMDAGDSGSVFRPDRAQSLLEEELEDRDYELYEVFASEHVYDDVVLSLNRGSIADLLLNEVVDGRKALAQLLPTWARLVVAT